MSCYKRSLKRGLFFFYSGQYMGVKYHSKAIYRKKSECERAERQRKAEIEEEVKNPGEEILLVDLCNERLDLIKLKYSAEYYKETKRYLKKLTEHLPRDTPVTRVTRADINRLVMKEAERLKKKGKGFYKVNSMIRILKALFNYGLKNHNLKMENPVKTDFFPVDNKLKYIPSDEELNKVLKDCNPKQELLVKFVEETACRINEAIRLRFDDVDEEYLTLYTRKAKNSDLVPRRIPTPECIRGLKGKGRVFKTWDAYPRFLQEKTERLCKRVWTWHNLRHKRASKWADQGMTIVELMVRLGHSNLQTTQRYVQLLGFRRF